MYLKVITICVIVRTKLQGQTVAANKSPLLEQRLSLALGVMSALQGNEAADTLITEAVALVHVVRTLSH